MYAIKPFTACQLQDGAFRNVIYHDLCESWLQYDSVDTILDLSDSPSNSEIYFISWSRLIFSWWKLSFSTSTLSFS